MEPDWSTAMMTCQGRRRGAAGHLGGKGEALALVEALEGGAHAGQHDEEGALAASGRESRAPEADLFGQGRAVP
jgi:hypothetical protein